MVKKMSNKRVILEAEKSSTLNSILWFTYDAADTYFSQLIISLAFTPFALLLGIKYFSSAANPYTVAFVVMSVFMAVSNLLVAILGPIIGSMSDVAGKRKGYVLMVAAVMIGASAAITALPTNYPGFTFWTASILFMIANFAYQNGRMLYDAQIPFIAEPKNRAVTQAVGGGVAPLGSILAVLTSMLVMGRFTEATHVSTSLWDAGTIDPNTIEFGGLRYLFLVGAIVIFIMAFPYLFHKEIQNPQKISLKENWKQSKQVFRSTGRDIIRDRNSILFFLAWFFITDAANTAILYMSPIITDAIGFPSSVRDIILFIAIGGSLIFGILTGVVMKKKGPKWTFIVNAICWSIGIVVTAFAGWNVLGIDGTKTMWLMYIGATFIGIGFGGIWIVGRQFIMVLAPPDKLAQYGGFQKIAGRVSAIVSPILFSVIMFVFSPLVGGTHHAYRVALGQLFVFFLIGLTILFFIKDPFKRYDAGERAPYTNLYVKVPK